MIRYGAIVLAILLSGGLAKSQIMPQVGISRPTEQTWTDAVQVFLHTAPGATWPGGARNMEIMQLTLQKLGLQNSKDKVGALTAGYAEMKRTQTIFPNDAIPGAKQEVSPAPSGPQVAAPLKVYVAATIKTQESRDMVNRLAGRVGTSNRYSLLSTPSGADLWLDVSCANITRGPSPRVTGEVCWSGYTYYPWRNQNIVLSVPIDGSLDIGLESDIADSIFDIFVRHTSDEELSKSATFYKNLMNATFLVRPDGIQ